MNTILGIDCNSMGCFLSYVYVQQIGNLAVAVFYLFHIMLLKHPTIRPFFTSSNLWFHGYMIQYNHWYNIFIWNNHSLQWRHNGRDSVSNHQPHDCLLNRLFRRRSKKTSKHRVTGLCAGNSPGPVNSPHKWPVTRKMFLLDDVIM